MGGVLSVGNLTSGISKGCRTLHLHPPFSGTPSSNKKGPDRLLSAEPVPSRGGPFVHPSETCCTCVHGLQVAVAVGLEGDPLGRKCSRTSSLSLSNCGGGRSSWDSRSYGSSPLTMNSWYLLRKFQHLYIILSIYSGKKCLADANASSQLTSLILRVLLGGST